MPCALRKLLWSFRDNNVDATSFASIYHPLHCTMAPLHKKARDKKPICLALQHIGNITPPTGHSITNLDADMAVNHCLQYRQQRRPTSIGPKHQAGAADSRRRQAKKALCQPETIIFTVWKALGAAWPDASHIAEREKKNQYTLRSQYAILMHARIMMHRAPTAVNTAQRSRRSGVRKTRVRFSTDLRKPVNKISASTIKVGRLGLLRQAETLIEIIGFS